MLSSTPQNGGYSADVRLQLIFNGCALDLAQIGPDRVVVRQPVAVAPCEAEVVMHVDGRERRWPVLLIEGISPDSPVVPTARSGQL